MNYQSDKKGSEIDSGVLLVLKKDITAQDFKSSSPIELLPAEVGVLYVPIALILEFTPGGVNYAGGNDIRINYSNMPTYPLFSFYIFNVTASAMRIGTKITYVLSASSVDVEWTNNPRGNAINWWNGGSAMSSGDGTAKLTMLYKKI